MRVVSMPTGTWLRRSRLARTSAPATRSGVASANSAATSARCTRRGVGASVDERPAGAKRLIDPQPRAVPGRTTPPMTTPLATRGRPARRRRHREAHFVDARHVVAAVDRDHPQDERGDAEPDQRRARRQQRRFDQDVLQQPAGRRAERAADRQLAAALQAARDQQVDGVGAGDEQHARDRRQHEAERRADVPDDARLQILQAPRGLLVLERRPPDRKEPAVGGAKRLDRRRGRTSGRSRPSTVVKNGPFRVGVGQRAGEKIAMSRSSGPTSFAARRRPWRCAPSIDHAGPARRIAAEAPVPVGMVSTTIRSSRASSDASKAGRCAACARPAESTSR